MKDDGYIQRAICVLSLVPTGLNAHQIAKETEKTYFSVQTLIRRYKDLDGYISHFMRAPTSKEEIIKIVSESNSWAQVGKKFGVSNKRARALGEALNLPSGHFCNPTSSHFQTRTEFIDYLQNLNRRPNSQTLYRGVGKFLYGGEPRCSCGVGAEWDGKPLRLQVDHIDGNASNNDVQNLRILCPNCHSQTPTYAAKNRSKAGKMTRHKIEWPTKEELTKLVWSKPKTILGKELGVSDKAIVRKCRDWGIKYPGLGYWAKQRAKQRQDQRK